MTQHGFARQSEWTVANTSADQQPDDRDPEIELVLEDSEYTRSMWYAHITLLLHKNLMQTLDRIWHLVCAGLTSSKLSML